MNKPMLHARDESLNFIAGIINRAIRDRATDIHWEPFIGNTGQREYVVRFRIDGVLRDVENINDQGHMDSMVNAIKIMGSLDPTKKRREQDGRLSFQAIDGSIVDVRLASMPTINGEKLVMRVMDRSRYCLSLEELGMSKEFIQTYNTLINKPEGFLIIVGPTGSGKTTTLYSTLQHICSREKNICTIEDPVECKFPGINQIQVDHEFGMTFVSGLRAIMRQDPNVIAVGEIRDGETARTAFQAALAGAMVFSTLHGRDSVHSIIRLLEMGVEPYFIASALTAILAQRLVRLLCKICRGKGCPQCMQTGFKRRIAIFDLLIMNDELRKMVLKKVSAEELAVAAGNNLISFQFSIDRLIAENLTTKEEVEKVFSAE